jgi:cob(I)alamin adenosyltransferase
MGTFDVELHKKKSQKQKEIFEKKLAAARREKGLLIVNTGTGKGKSTAAFGMGLRILGHGKRLGVVQFIKGAIATAERTVLENFSNCDFKTIGDGYTWNTQNFAADVATAKNGWEEARRMINDPTYDMVILDELNIVLKHNYLDLEEVLKVFKEKREMLHIVVTGRHAHERLIEIADLVSEIRPLKHPYKEQGVKAQAGIEF